MRATVLLLALSILSVRAEASTKKLAVVVGSNKGALGRAPLRYANTDAEEVARVLTSVGGFAPTDVRVLADPSPKEIISELEADLSTEPALLLFYYSGHADERALYPNGEPLSIAELRSRLDDQRATLRVGIMDACRGGGWTGSKGLVPATPFEIPPEPWGAVPVQGSVLLASSSGVEDAHEAEAIKGSFFTHHLVAALRGAGDKSADGEVTVSEAFDYAKRMTIRDAALYATTPQSPSFRINVSGKQDLVLARIDQSPSQLVIAQLEGPLELVALESGVRIVEMQEGERRIRLAVPAGSYVLRRRAANGLFAKEVHVAAGETVTLEESSLELIGSGVLALKSMTVRPSAATTLPAGIFEMRSAFGIHHTADTLSGGLGAFDIGPTFQLFWTMSIGLTDRLQLNIPGTFAYRFGDRGSVEVIPFGGVEAFGLGFDRTEDFLEYSIVGGASSRIWLDADQSLVFGFDARSKGRRSTIDVPGSRYGPKTWRATLRAAHTIAIGERVTFNWGLTLRATVLDHLEYTSPFEANAQAVLSLGSTIVGGRNFPLVQIQITDNVAIEGSIELSYDFSRQHLDDVYGAGVRVTW